MRRLLAAVCVLVAWSLAPHAAEATPDLLRPGANHHLGDDSFVARFQRTPDGRDSEKLRMRVHLQYVHDLLAARPATSPALAGRRAELLGYLADYIARGITPINDYIPQRNPVFIDRDGRICAVGYLIERSSGRDVAEAIAATHRLDYLEDIAAAMPEVAGWIASSGFTLDELASIQPGYPGPEVQHQAGWLTASTPDDWQQPIGITRPADGVYADEASGMTGTFRGGQMIGVWTRTVAGKTLGKGTFTRGAGTWTSFRADGSKLAEGPFSRSHANGTWKIFHPSGRLAATGPIRDGRRDGTWTFFYDDARSTVLSRGSFSAGQTDGAWRHYDARGNLVARSSGAAWSGLSIDIEPGRDGVRREIHMGIPAEAFRLDGFYLGKDRLYVDEAGMMFDGQGRQLTIDDGRWHARACAWPAKHREIARIGDVTTLHQLLRRSAPPMTECKGAVTEVPAALARRYATMLASRKLEHAATPAFDVDPRPAASEGGDPEPGEPRAVAEVRVVEDNADDFATYLANGLRWYVEWPHVDDTFRTIYATLPGYGPQRDL